MQLDGFGVAALGLSLLVGCESTRAPASGSAPSEALLVAGGETSEFSGGNVPYGYCPVVVTRTALDLAREDVAKWVALAEGHHEVSLRWSRRFPDDKIRGFEERTSLLLDVTVLGGEDVLCVSEPNAGYESSGIHSQLRRLDLSVEFATADGAVSGTFRRPFVEQVDATGAQSLLGGERFPFEQVAGTLELGVDPELVTEPLTLSLDISFSEQTVSGALTPWVLLPGPYDIGGGRPSWVPVSGTFPAPDEGCEAGVAVPLDEPIDFLAATPRAAYELARARLPAQPLRAAWQDPWHAPRSLTWTELALSPGAPTHACLGRDLAVYAPLRLESADGQVVLEQIVAAQVGLQPAAPGQAPAVQDFSMFGSGRWTQRAEFEAEVGIRDLDLGLADYGALNLSQMFDNQRDRLQGELSVRKWEAHLDRAVERPVLHWCAGNDCDAYFCNLTATDDGSSCR